MVHGCAGDVDTRRCAVLSIVRYGDDSDEGGDKVVDAAMRWC